MGLLWADINSDLLDAASWTKSKEPVFQTSDKNNLFGPGHNSFTIAEDGKTDLLVYHARPYEEIIGDPLFDPNRHTCVQAFTWDENGMPVFGEPGN
jgi:GH43 family beta-xylosidase